MQSQRSIQAAILLFAVLMGSVLGTSSAFAEDGLDGQPGLLAREFVYAQGPPPRCHASTMTESGDALVAAWFGGTDEGHDDVGIWVSRKTGDTWSKPVEVANGVQHADKRYPTWNPVLYQDPDGPLLLFYKAGPNPREWWGMLMTSDDHGETWSEPRRLPEDIAGPIKNKPVLLEDGVLLCPSSTEDEGWRVHFELTSDNGITWKRVGPINDGKEFGAIQPTILIHEDGGLQALCRTRQRTIGQSFSSDGGQHWDAMTASSLPNNNSGIDAVTLDDGRHLLIYNHTTRGRSPLNVAVSDDGITWKAALVLENQPGEYSYPCIVQTSDGLVHAMYTWKRDLIRHAVIDLSKIEAREMNHGKWPAN